VDGERRRWLDTLAAACERVLVDDRADVTDPGYAAIRTDVAELLSRITAEQDTDDATP
jgi:hypothetical protein